MELSKAASEPWTVKSSCKEPVLALEEEFDPLSRLQDKMDVYTLSLGFGENRANQNIHHCNESTSLSSQSLPLHHPSSGSGAVTPTVPFLRNVWHLKDLELKKIFITVTKVNKDLVKLN